MLTPCTVPLSLLLVLGSQAMSGGNYPNAKMLMEPAPLSKADVAEHFVIVDARPRQQYDAGRIRGAVWVDAAAWAKAFKENRDPAAWSTRIGSLGIGHDAHVVIYDDNFFSEAARIWWILRYWGLDDVRLLSGNWTTGKRNACRSRRASPRRRPPNLHGRGTLPSG